MHQICEIVVQGINLDPCSSLKVAGYQRGVAEVGYKTARRLEKSKLDEAELAYTENGGIQRSDC